MPDRGILRARSPSKRRSRWRGWPRGDTALAAFVRDRLDLPDEWQHRDEIQAVALGQIEVPAREQEELAVLFARCARHRGALI